MAVVSISRIQVRRGRKQSGSGLPQLASGELGWAIDTQELFIGNGSVAEGSPYVGNTKLLSEHDNLFEFADTYAYKNTGGNVQTGESPNSPVFRTLQERLDDRVSIRSFGAMGDGTDQTTKLQRAIDQLFLNPSNKSTPQARVELIIEPGEYLISNSICLPPFATIRGAGADKTFIKVTGAGQFAAFKTVNETSEIGEYASDAVSDTSNQARNIEVSDLTIETTTSSALELVSCRNSRFTNINMKGTWDFGAAAVREAPAILMSGLSSVVNCNYNVFDNVSIENYGYGVVSDQDISNNVWDHCNFNTCYAGVVFGELTVNGIDGQETGPFRNIITNSTFDLIASHAINIYNGPENTSEANKFYNVGNDGGVESNASYPIIEFADKGCTSINDYFQRSELLGNSQTYLVNVPYVREVEGSVITELNRSHTIPINESPEATKLFKLPAATPSLDGSSAVMVGRSYVIDYTYRSTAFDAVRTGVMTLVLDPANDTYNMTDEYDFTGDELYQENLVLSIQTYDENGDSELDTVAIMMLNYTTSDEAEFIYRVRYKS